MAGAVHRASWRSCGACGRRWGRGCLSRGRRRASWRTPASHTSLITTPLLITTHHTSTSHGSTSHHYSSQLITSQPITTYHIPTHHSPTSHTSLITAPLIITTHHSSTSDRSTSHHYSSQLITSQLITAPLLTGPLLITTHHNLSHPNSSQLHFWQVHFSSQLITTYHNPTHDSSSSHTSLLTPYLSHHNFLSQLITTYHIPTHHSSTSHTPSHTSLITSELTTAPLLTPAITGPLLTPHFSHLPEVYIDLRYIKACQVGLSGSFIFLFAGCAENGLWWATIWDSYGGLQTLLFVAYASTIRIGGLLASLVLDCHAWVSFLDGTHYAATHYAPGRVTVRVFGLFASDCGRSMVWATVVKFCCSCGLLTGRVGSMSAPAPVPWIKALPALTDFPIWGAGKPIEPPLFAVSVG